MNPNNPRQSISTPAPPASKLRRLVKLFIWIILGLAVLGALVVLEENWRGERAWKKFKGRLEAQGERLDRDSVIPAPVPDEQNFAMTPLLAPLLDYELTPEHRTRWRDSNALARIYPRAALNVYAGGAEVNSVRLGDWRAAQRTDLKAWQEYYRSLPDIPKTPEPRTPAEDVLLALSRYETELDELQEASQRPYGRFPIHWDEGFQMQLPHLAVTKKLSQLLQLRASAALAAGQVPEAFADLRLQFRLLEMLRVEPLLIAHLVRVAMLNRALQAVWEGIVDHRWPEEHLAALDQQLAKMDFIGGQIQAIRGERAFVNWIFDRALENRAEARQVWAELSDTDEGMALAMRRAPRALIRQNQLAVNRYYLAAINLLKSLVTDSGSYQPLNRDRLESLDETLGTRTPYNILAHLLLPAITKCVEKTQEAQATVDLARAAVALERYRLAQGAYPVSLDALVPQFCPRVPADIVTGQPLHYRRASAGQYLLYSVGSDEIDDNGELALGANQSERDYQGGDWVWRFPK